MRYEGIVPPTAVTKVEWIVVQYEIDGERFSYLEEFYDEVSRVVLMPGVRWGHNLDAFNDVLRGGFGTPEDGFVIRRKNHDVSRERLGYPETIRQLESQLETCHPSWRAKLATDLSEARAEHGRTVFDWLVEIIQSHGAGGGEAQDRVTLILD